MEKAPAGLVQKRQGYATEPLRQFILFFTPLRTIQFLGFLLVFVLSFNLAGTEVLAPADRFFYDLFLKGQPAPKVDPAIVYVGIDRNSLQTIRPFPWPQRYYAAMTRILREWGAKAIVLDLFFQQTADAPEDEKAFLEELKKTPNFYLPISFESEGFKNYYHVNQSAPVFSSLAKGIGHVNDTWDPDRVIRRAYPFVRFNGQLVPHLGIRVAYDYLERPVPMPERCDFPRDRENYLLIHWAKRWNAVPGYYPFADVLSSYALVSKGQPAPISAKDFKGKICLIGMTTADPKATPLESASPGLSVLGNVINTVLTKQYLRVLPSGFEALLLFVIAVLGGLMLVPFRGVFSILGILVLAGFWIVVSFALFSWAGIWTGVAAPLFLLAACFLISLTIAKIEEYKERLYLMSLAVRDELTGLYSMRYISTFLEQALNYSRTFKKPFAVILLDIDDFRKINDAYGYRTGDAVLKKTAGIIHSAIRTQNRAMPDVAGRYGEEEFIVILVGYNLATATFGVAERIRKAIDRATFEAGRPAGAGEPRAGATAPDKTFHITISAGVSVLQPGEKAPERVVERAQEALLKAKIAGKNQTCIYNG